MKILVVKGIYKLISTWKTKDYKSQNNLEEQDLHDQTSRFTMKLE